MATVNIQTGKPIRFTDGGTVEFDWNGGSGGGVDQYSVLSIVEGSLRYDDPGATRIIDRDRGALSTKVRRGSDNPINVTMSIKHTYDIGTNDLITRMADDDDSNGYVPSFQLVVKIPDYRGAATGVSLTFSDCVFASGPGHESGDEFDTLAAEIICVGGVVRASY